MLIIIGFFLLKIRGKVCNKLRDRVPNARNLLPVKIVEQREVIGQRNHFLAEGRHPARSKAILQLLLQLPHTKLHEAHNRPVVRPGRAGH